MSDPLLPPFPSPPATRPIASNYRIHQETVWRDHDPMLTGLAGPGWQIAPDPIGPGVFLTGSVDQAAAQIELTVGKIVGLQCFTAAARNGPFWTKPTVGTRETDIPPATLWLLARTGKEAYTLLVPLLSGAGSFTLGSRGDALVVRGESGDPAVKLDGGTALYIATGTDPYALLSATALAVRQHHGNAEAGNKPNPPDFVDLFGWCTWDAFYHDVSPEKLREGLAAFAAAGVEPRVVVLDDGWQSVQTKPTGEERLISLAPNTRFNGDLSRLVRAAKEEFRVERFFVWHALLGYWGGLCPESLPNYATTTVARAFGPSVLATQLDANDGQWSSLVGVPAADQIARFYDDYHRQLSAQGVDGVKVDNQAALEAVSAGQGGRVALGRTCRNALETSVRRHFDGRLIHCMSCTPEGVYLGNRAVMRTSDDFWPLRPETHGAHVYCNAHASLWFGEFMLPDWDMFQSQHPFGTFHAAARAVSGGPVYVSDKPGKHDAALLRKLVLSDGKILRANQPGRLTYDCLFVDPTVDPVLLKIFNSHQSCGMLGVFNARPPTTSGDSAPEISGIVSPSDVVGLRGTEFVEYRHNAATLQRCGRADTLPITLSAGDWEIVTYAPIDHDFAAIGLSDKLNSAGAIQGHRRMSPQTRVLNLRDGGRFLAWSARPPDSVVCGGCSLPHIFDPQTGTLAVDVPPGGSCELTFSWT